MALFRRSFCFNTQPPEGGWVRSSSPSSLSHLFQHTAARRRLDFRRWVRQHNKFVSTHSRPKAAGLISLIIVYPVRVSTHSRPKAAGTAYQRQQTQVQFQHTAARRRLVSVKNICQGVLTVSTHSRPKAAGGGGDVGGQAADVSTHSRPKAAGRRGCRGRGGTAVSTHSRPKAAGQTAKRR